MKLSKALVLPIASAALVVVGAGAVLAATAPAAPSTGATSPAAASSSPAPAASSKPVAPYLRSVLDGLVAKGTITPIQEQAIVDAWVAKRGEVQAERKQVRAFLSDGVLTTNELAQLPADSPLQALKPLMANGQITVDELRQLGRGILSELRMGGMRGQGNGNDATTPVASPATGG